jgi:hypothetical protein
MHQDTVDKQRFVRIYFNDRERHVVIQVDKRDSVNGLPTTAVRCKYCRVDNLENPVFYKRQPAVLHCPYPGTVREAQTVVNNTYPVGKLLAGQADLTYTYQPAVGIKREYVIAYLKVLQWSDFTKGGKT